MKNLPIEIINKIKEYIPRDKDMYSNTSNTIKYFICYYNNLAFNNEGVDGESFAFATNKPTGFVDYTFSEYYFKLQRIHMFFH